MCYSVHCTNVNKATVNKRKTLCIVFRTSRNVPYGGSGAAARGVWQQEVGTPPPGHRVPGLRQPSH